MKKIALITGGTRGIGLGIAHSMADAGYDLALNGMRSEDRVQNVLDQLRTTGRQVIYCPGDISDPEVREQIMDKVRQQFGQLNVLVNNAGVAPRVRKDLLDTAEEDFNWLLRINLNGPFFLAQKAAKWFLEQKRAASDFKACIINVGSVSATLASINRGEYCISKAGIAMMSRLFALRLAEEEIPVYELRPGIIETDMTSAVKEKYDRLIEDGLIPEKRWGRPEDIGRTAAALAEGAMPYATGQVIMLDGGLTLPRL